MLDRVGYKTSYVRGARFGDMSHADATPPPTRWLMKNTDTNSGFAHAMNTYLAGVALAADSGAGLIHRPQVMAHGLGFTFVDFFDTDPRGLVPPVYAPYLHTNGSAMYIDGAATQLHVSTTSAGVLSSLPPGSLLWLRKGRAAYSNPALGCTTNHEVCATALWLRERFWWAVMARQARSRERHSVGKSQVPGLPQVVAKADASGGPIRIAIHVRRGDMVWLDKTHSSGRWVDSETVLDVLLGVRRALGMPLEEPAVVVDLFSEKGWLSNETDALRAIAPGARVHLESTPAATVSALIRMSKSDLLIMGSSGFSVWAGIFSCGVKIGFLRGNAEPLPMRFVEYASTATTKTAPFWPSAGEALRSTWERYWSCRRNPACRPSLCERRHLSPGNTALGSVWVRSKLGYQAYADETAVQWRLPELVLWPNESTAIGSSDGGREGASLASMRSACAAKAKAPAPIHAPPVLGRAFGLDACMRNEWLTNLTKFLAARKKTKKKPLVAAVERR